MARTRAVSAIVGIVRSKYNLPTPAGNTWPTDTDLLNFIASGVDELAGIMHKAYGNDPVRELLNQETIAAGAQPAATPATMFRIVEGPYISEDGINFERLLPAGNDFEAWVKQPRGTPVFYQMSGGVYSLRVAPLPDRSLTLLYRYSALTTPTSTADNVSGPVGWEDFVATWACHEIALAEKETANIRNWKDRLAAARASLWSNLNPVDVGAVQQVEDVYGADPAAALGDVERYHWYRSGPSWRRF